MAGLERVTARRVWFVPNVVVWGLPSLGEVAFLAHETIESNATVHYNSIAAGQAEQHVTFDLLTDHRGNKLPSSISAPRVILRPHEQHSVFIVGEESPQGFRVARDPDAPGSVIADFLIMELGD